MKIIGEHIPYDGHYIRVKEVQFESNGLTGVWETVERKTFGKIVSIFALTKDNEVILERSFRIPINSYIIELPAGLMDKKSERPEETIKRELLEETGYTFPGEPTLILEGPFNAGLLADEMMIFFAQEAAKVSEPDLEFSEDITVIKVPLEKLVDFVTHPSENCPIDIKILNVVPILQQRGLVACLHNSVNKP